MAESNVIVSKQLSRIALDDDSASSGSDRAPPEVPRITRAASRHEDTTSKGAQESSASEEDLKAKRGGSPGRALREAHMDEMMRLRGGRRRNGEAQDVDMACCPPEANKAKRLPPTLLLRASTESEVATLRKMAVQAVQVGQQKAAKRSAVGNSSSTGPKRKAGRLAERRLRAKIQGSKKDKSPTSKAAQASSSSDLGVAAPIANVEKKHYDSDDMMHQHSSSSASASEGPSAMLTAAALIAAANVRNSADSASDSPPSSPAKAAAAYTPHPQPHLPHDLFKFASTSSSKDGGNSSGSENGIIEARARCNELYGLHLGVLPSPIECIRNEIRDPSELRFYRLPDCIISPMPLVTDKKNQELQIRDAEMAEPQSAVEAQDNDLDYISMRDLEKDWDEWRWESYSSGEEFALSDYTASTPALQEAMVTA